MEMWENPLVIHPEFDRIFAARNCWFRKITADLVGDVGIFADHIIGLLTVMKLPETIISWFRYYWYCDLLVDNFTFVVKFRASRFASKFLLQPIDP